MVLCYLGEPGGYGTWGRNRKVFSSDTATPYIWRMFKSAGPLIRAEVEQAGKNPKVRLAMHDVDVAARYSALLALVDPARAAPA